MTLGRDEEALRFLDGEPGPDVSADRLTVRRAVATWNSGRIRDAIDGLRHRGVFSGQPESDHALAWMLLQTRSVREAVDPARSAMMALPDDPAPLATLAAVQIAVGDPVAGQASANRLDRFPSLSRTRFELLGIAALAQGRWGLAEQRFGGALQQEPESYEALVGRAAALDRLGRRTEAFDGLVTAIRRDPHGVPARVQSARIVGPYLLTGVLVMLLCVAGAIAAAVVAAALGVPALWGVAGGLTLATLGAIVWHRRRRRSVPPELRPERRAVMLTRSNWSAVWSRWDWGVLLLLGVSFFVVFALTGTSLPLGLVFGAVGVRRLINRESRRNRGIPPFFESLADT